MEQDNEQQEMQFNNPKEVFDWLQKNRIDRPFEEYVAEYEGDRNLRELQVGKREMIKQGKDTIPPEIMIINLQRKIVRTAVSFLLGNEPTITSNEPESEEAQAVMRILKKNRFTNKLKKFAESVKSQTLGVFIFNIDDASNNNRVRFRYYTTEQGTFTPQYDAYGDLIAFYWEFEDSEGVENLYVFDKTNVYVFKDQKFEATQTHGFGVIPVVFLEQKKPEWWDVKELIDRLEMIQSKLAASNNFFAFPILKLKGALAKNESGETETLIKPSEDGKTLALGWAEKNGQVIEADAEFLQRDPAIDSITAEVENLLKFIYSISQTPDLSFENVKGIGAVSGAAIELMFMDAINKAKWDEGDFSTVIERVISVIRSGINNGAEKDSLNEELEFNAEFNLSIPKDLKEEVMTLIEAAGGKAILSRSSAVKQSPLTYNAQDEIKELEEQERIESGDTLNFGFSQPNRETAQEE